MVKGMLLLALMLAVGDGVAAEVFSCTDKYGHLVVSDKPCSPDAKRTEVQEQPRTGAQVFGGDTSSVLARPVEKSELAKQPRSSGPDCPSDLDLKAKAMRDQIALCMDDSHLRTILGKYARDYTTENQARAGFSGELRRYGVRPQGFPLYVEMENGRVVGWFDHELNH
jgi:hypothetical protein